MRVVAGGAKRARLRPNPQFYGLLPSRAVSHEKPCAMAHESHVGNDSQERRVDTPHVVRCVVAGTCGYTCRPLTSRASLTRHLFIWSSRDLPRSSCSSRPVRGRSPPTSPVHLPRSLECRDSCRPTRRSIGRATRQIPVPRLETPPRSRPAREPRPPAGPSAVLLLDQKRLPKLTFFESSRRTSG